MNSDDFAIMQALIMSISDQKDLGLDIRGNYQELNNYCGKIASTIGALYQCEHLDKANIATAFKLQATINECFAYINKYNEPLFIRKPILIDNKDTPEKKELRRRAKEIWSDSKLISMILKGEFPADAILPQLGNAPRPNSPN